MVLTVADVLLSSLDSAIVLSGSTTAVFVIWVGGDVAGEIALILIVAFWPWFTAPPMQMTVIGLAGAL